MIAIIKKCDRCGATYEQAWSNVSSGVIILDFYSDDEECFKNKHFDLCPDCLSKIRYFLNNKEGNAVDE